MNYLVYQAYGHHDILNEALYSILSFIRLKQAGHHRDVEIIVYTDSPALFTDTLGPRTDIHLEPINDAIIRQWRGDIDFVHRVKINVLIDCFSKYNGNLLYADTDTVFSQEISELFEAMAQGKVLMHALEARIEDRNSIMVRKLAAGLKKSMFTAADGTTFTIPLTTPMWNAGVLGIPLQYKGLLQEVLSITDQSYRINPMHISEQFAFSYVLGKSATVISAEPYIYHYWNFKEFRQVLAAFFEHNKGQDIDTLIARIGLIDTQTLHQPKLQYEALPMLRRSLKRKSGKPWQLPAYRLE